MTVEICVVDGLIAKMVTYRNITQAVVYSYRSMRKKAKSKELRALDEIEV